MNITLFINCNYNKAFNLSKKKHHGVLSYIVFLLLGDKQTNSVCIYCIMISHRMKMFISIAYPPRLQASGEAQGEPSSVPSCLGTKSFQTLLLTGWCCIYTALKPRGWSPLCPVHITITSIAEWWQSEGWRTGWLSAYADRSTAAVSSVFSDLVLFNTVIFYCCTLWFNF